MGKRRLAEAARQTQRRLEVRRMARHMHLQAHIWVSLITPFGGRAYGVRALDLTEWGMAATQTHVRLS